MDRDFLDRTVLNIITDNNIMPFIVINKLHFLIGKIWDGKESDLIDGKISHFSRTNYLVNHQIKSLRGVKVSIGDIMGRNFRPDIHGYNFMYQFKFRMQSVLLHFYKDSLCAGGIMVIFQYINYSYLNLFTERRYENAPDETTQLDIIADNLVTYKSINFIGTIMSVSYFLNLLCRVIYNSFAKKKIPMDIWLIFDCMAGVVNIIAFNIVGSTQPERIYDVNGTKRIFDYYMIIVLIISWLRFFSYFLVMQHISKITLTLFMMLKEAGYFLFVLACYMVLITTVFATLFRDATTEDGQDYHSIFMTLRDMFDYFLANYNPKDLGNYNTSHSILYIVHVTISNIFLLNFLVAILQTVFEVMI